MRLSAPRSLGAFATTVRRSVRYRGYWGTLKLVRAYPFTLIKRALPRYRRLRDQPQTFDKEHQVDTSGFVSGKELPLKSIRSDATAYYATPPSVIGKIVEQLPEDLSRFVFVDYGSGKGRVVLLASHYNFKEIIGIEYARELHEIAVW